MEQVEDKYDYCLIDCPPSLNMITINALVASDEVIVPIKIDKFALDGLGYLLDSIDDIQTLITCTGVDEFVNHRFSINKIFYVHEGQVRNEN